MICKAVAEGASAFYFYKVGKGELFLLVKSSPSRQSLLPLQKHAWSRKSKTVGLCPTCPLAFSKARQNFKGKTSFFQWRYEFSGEGGRSWTLSIPASIWKGLSETLKGRTFFTCEKFSRRYAPPPSKTRLEQKDIEASPQTPQAFWKKLDQTLYFLQTEVFL